MKHECADNRLKEKIKHSLFYFLLIYNLRSLTNSDIFKTELLFQSHRKLLRFFKSE